MALSDPILYSGYISNELIEKSLVDLHSPSFFWNMTSYYPEAMFYNQSFYKEIKNDSFYLGKKFIEEFSIHTNVKIKEIFKMQFNVFFMSKNHKKLPPPHVDSKTSHMVFLCYLNNSDGDTYIYDNDLNVIKKISPEKGKYIVFDGNFLHSGSFPKESYARMVLNINFDC